MDNPPPMPPTGQTTTPFGSPPLEDGTSDRKDRNGCLIGCLIAFGLSIIMCGGVGFYVYSNAPDWIASGLRSAMREVLSESAIPEGEQQELLSQFDRVAEAYRQGEINVTDLAEVMQELAESPIGGLVVLQVIDEKYLKPSGLSEEEKAAARRAVMRITRGTVEDKIDSSDLDPLTQFFVNRPQENTYEVKESVTDDELREFTAKAKELADTKEIPDEDYEVDLTAIVTKIVDEALTTE